MSSRPSFTALFTVLALLPLAAGCPGSSSDKPEENSSAREDHGHSHDEGPEGGHILELGDEEYHVEWLHDDDEGRLTFIIRDADVKEEVPIDAESLTIKMTTKGEDEEAEVIEEEIPAVGRTDENPKTARFEAVNKSIIGIIDSGKAKIVLFVPIADKTYEAEIKHDAHHGHSHSH